MSIRAKLNRLKPHLSIDKKETSETELVSSKKNEIPFIEKLEKENVTPYYFDGDYCLIREKTYPLRWKHGKYTFSHFVEAVRLWNNASVHHPLSAKGYTPDQLFFFDTETTGLSGTGSTIFILGYASLQEDEIVLRQHILPQPGSEIPLYKSFLENINYETLVTYNGKAFDWPQLKTRHTLIREHVPRLPPFGHFDLYHASRRLWKHRLERLTLSNVEKEILNVERKDDIPGYLAPMIYFDFIERKDPEGLIGVLKHNEIDILSLITLYTHISFQLLNFQQHETNDDTFEVGRWYSTIGERKIAKKAFTKVAEGKGVLSEKGKYSLSLELKKQKKWEEAVSLWLQLSESNTYSFAYLASIELAKYYEHRLKDLKMAYHFSLHSRKILKEQEKLLSISIEDKMKEVDKRINRLQEKMDRLIRKKS